MVRSSRSQRIFAFLTCIIGMTITVTSRSYAEGPYPGSYWCDGSVLWTTSNGTIGSTNHPVQDCVASGKVCHEYPSRPAGNRFDWVGVAGCIDRSQATEEERNNQPPFDPSHSQDVGNEYCQQVGDDHVCNNYCRSIGRSQGLCLYTPDYQCVCQG